MKTHDARHTPGPRLLWQRFTTSGDEEEDEVANNDDNDDHHDDVDNEDSIAMKTTAATAGPHLFLHLLPINDGSMIYDNILAKHHINAEADDKVTSCLHLLDQLIKKNCFSLFLLSGTGSSNDSAVSLSLVSTASIYRLHQVMICFNDIGNNNRLLFTVAGIGFSSCIFTCRKQSPL